MQAFRDRCDYPEESRPGYTAAVRVSLRWLCRFFQVAIPRCAGRGSGRRYIRESWLLAERGRLASSIRGRSARKAHTTRQDPEGLSEPVRAWESELQSELDRERPIRLSLPSANVLSPAYPFAGSHEGLR